MANERIVWCEACQSEGRILTSDGGPDDTDRGPCPHCEGTGAQVIETQPIEMEDLTEMEITSEKISYSAAAS